MTKTDWRNFWDNHRRLRTPEGNKDLLEDPEPSPNGPVLQLQKVLRELQLNGNLLTTINAKREWNVIRGYVVLKNVTIYTDTTVEIRAGDVVITEGTRGVILTQLPKRSFAGLYHLLSPICSPETVGIFLPLYAEVHLTDCIWSRMERDRALQIEFVDQLARKQNWVYA